MREKENLSVEEILREADEMLNQISARSKSAAEYTEKEEVKAYVPKSSENNISHTKARELPRLSVLMHKPILIKDFCRKETS